MKNTFLIITVLLFLVSCSGLNKQVNQIKALENCKYEISSADSIYVANVDVKELMEQEKISLAKMPRLALALLRQNVPLQARITLSISNPSDQIAAINQFEYKVLVKNRELANGFVNQKIAVSPNGGIATIPIQINSNIYHILSDDKTMEAISDFIISPTGESNAKAGVVTIKIKPTLDLGNRQIQYPGYITINKELNSINL